MMPSNQQDEDQTSLNFDEAKAAIEKGFGSTIGTLSINNALLEKRAQRQTELIEMLQVENANLKAELSRRPLPPLSPEAAALAAEGSALLADNGDEGKKKAAPVEAT